MQGFYMKYNIYCDESCHLENDRMKAMVLGAIWCQDDKKKYLFSKIKLLKKQYGIPSEFEIKWTKVSPSKLDFYKDIVNLFFDEPLLHFRAVVIPNKQKLNHINFNQSHDDFYYKMWYILLNHLITPNNIYQIYIDIKDTQGKQKINKLHDVLCNSNYDFDRSIIHSIEQVQSHDVILLQIVDLLIGALSYLHRNLSSSPAKQALIEQIKKRSGLSLMKNSLWGADKFNLLVWEAQPC